LRKSFYGDDVPPLNLTDRNQTAVDDLAVNEHRAGPALPFTAALFRAGLGQVFAQHIEESS